MNESFFNKLSPRGKMDKEITENYIDYLKTLPAEEIRNIFSDLLNWSLDDDSIQQKAEMLLAELTARASNRSTEKVRKELFNFYPTSGMVQDSQKNSKAGKRAASLQASKQFDYTASYLTNNHENIIVEDESFLNGPFLPGCTEKEKDRALALAAKGDHTPELSRLLEKGNKK